MGKNFKGVYNLLTDTSVLYKSGQGHTIQERREVKGLDNPDLDQAVGADYAQELRDTLELVQGASHEFDLQRFLDGKLSPVFFGTGPGQLRRRPHARRSGGVGTAAAAPATAASGRWPPPRTK